MLRWSLLRAGSTLQEQPGGSKMEEILMFGEASLLAVDLVVVWLYYLQLGYLLYLSGPQSARGGPRE